MHGGSKKLTFLLLSLPSSVQENYHQEKCQEYKESSNIEENPVILVTGMLQKKRLKYLICFVVLLHPR